jgi:hypothetical protein
MLVEVEPYHFTEQDLRNEEWDPGFTVVHMLNQAWHQFQTDMDSYPEWEHQAVFDLLHIPLEDLWTGDPRADDET